MQGRMSGRIRDEWQDKAGFLIRHHENASYEI
jgi:hypothetical protein